MDPEGVRVVFHAECGAAPDYGVRRALRELPFLARWTESFFFGLHLPLTRPLPKRLDATLQQHVGLHALDAVVLADIDPCVFDTDDLYNLLAYVEGGGGVLMIGGPHSFSSGQRNWGPFREAMPAVIELQPDKATRLWNDPPAPESTCPAAPVTLAADHPIARGLSGPLGEIRHAQPCRPTASAAIVARSEQAPIILAGTYGRGRVVMVSAYPGDATDTMFRTPAWGELLRQTMAWLMRRDQDLAITACAIDSSPRLAGDQRRITLRLAADPGAGWQAQAAISRADPGWLAAGREPQFEPVQRSSVPVQGDTVDYEFVPPAPGLWQVRIEVTGAGAPPRTGDGLPPVGRQAPCNVRIVTLDARSPADLRLWIRHGGFVAAPGRALPLAASATRPLSGQLTIRDFDGREVLRRERVTAGAIDVPLPRLETGDYEAALRAGDDEARVRFSVADPLRRIGFSFVANAHGATEERIDWWVDYFTSRGFTAFSTGLPSPEDRLAPPPAFDATAYQQYRIQRDGLDLWGEYSRLTLLSTHAHYGDEGSRPTRPCLFDPEHAAALRGMLDRVHLAAERIPRLASFEILDEPHLMRGNVCRCARCRSEFERRHGYPMPTWDEAIAARDGRTRDYFEWIVEYAAEAFRLGYETWKSLGPGPSLHHVLCGIGSGCLSAAHGVAEDLPWAPHADFVEFDCYNYMYPHWRGSRSLRWNEFHYLSGHFRFLARRNRQRFGFYIQVTDRDAPVTPWDPLRAPSETLYTAVGAGAKTFHLMSKGPFSSKQNCREEKFDAFAADVRKVRQVAPLLDRAEPPQRSVAMVFPFHDRLYRIPPRRLPDRHVGLGFYGLEARPYDAVWPYHRSAVNVAELLVRSFGEADVIDQRALRDGALDGYGGLVLAGVEYMDDADARAIEDWVRRGGALICDGVPSRNLAGGASAILAPVFEGAEPEHFHRQVTLTRSTCDRGRGLLLSADLNELYTAAVEGEDLVLQEQIEAVVRVFFFGAGLRPHAASSNAWIEANMLRTSDTLVLVAVNHAGGRQRGHITLHRPPIRAVAARDMVTRRSVAFRQTAEGIEVDADLDEREGWIVGFYPSVAERLELVPDSARAEAGGRLGFTVRLLNEVGAPARGDQIVDVRVADAGGTERRAYGGRLCATNGVLRVEEPLADNARRGRWTITAFEPFTGREVTSAVDVS